MSQTHHLPVILNHGSGTQAYWALNPAHTLILFVHGFRGQAVGTWTDFASLLPAEACCAEADILFYGYDATHSRCTVSAALLRDFMSMLDSNPKATISEAAPEVAANRHNFTYERFVVVAHSLGAVVAREALLYGLQERLRWAARTELVLFAPAHNGANILPLLNASAILARLVPFLRLIQVFGHFTVLADLEPGCAHLEWLRQATNEALRRGASSLIARRVILGGKDNVVNPTPFGQDPAPVVFQGCDHLTVCKPGGDFMRPVEEMRDLL
jgi:pimeloyl-ACP methyl ester carboxylesterase